MSKLPIQAVPTNVITGFLGVGKTSTILHLLKSKPKNERWAVLVNEFGEIGIDGALYESQFSEHQGVFIRELPGGCMCCTAGVPMQVALPQLIRRAKPDRLLIEPTGLGHPDEVLKTLNNQNFSNIISLQKVVTLVDARQLADSRYAGHETYQRQISIADVIVANKQDLYNDNEKELLKKYLQERSLSDLPVLFTEQGVIDVSLLEGINLDKDSDANSLSISKSDHHHHHHDEIEESIPECGFIKAVNKGEGFFSMGWRFSSDFKFDKNKLFAFITGVNGERLKATFITNEGCFAYNSHKDAVSEIPSDFFEESRIEIIASELNPLWEDDLFACRI